MLAAVTTVRKTTTTAPSLLLPRRSTLPCLLPLLLPPARHRLSARSLHTSPATMFALTHFRGNAADKPTTFSKQASLPRLPVPALRATLTSYLASLEPILLQAEEMGQLASGATAESELAKRRQWAEAAVAHDGTLVQRLQRRLEDVRSSTPHNWLDDRYWLQKAYHEWRVPLLVNSNWWLMFRADAGTPAAVLEQPDTKVEHTGDVVPSEEMTTAMGANTWTELEYGLRRATWLTYRTLLFKQRLDAEDIMPDASRAGPFCMHQYTRLFGVTRIAAIPHDWNTEASHPIQARHIVVMARNNIYTLDVVAEDGKIVSLHALEQSLRAIVEDARKADGAPVGILTATARDDWARAREHLLSLSSANRANVSTIQSALFALCLDSSVLPLPRDHADVAHSCTPAGVDAHARNCSGAGRGGLNRWFDKALSIVVESNGRAGIMGEHSPCDALIPSIVVEFAAAVPAPKPDTPLEGTYEGAGSSVAGPVKKLTFDLDDATHQHIRAAYAVARQTSGESDIGELWFDEYGTEWIKKVAKQSPDAYIQQALQLAMWKVHGAQTPTYETASTRMYQHGRTDVIRSFSRESYAFVRAVREKKVKPAELYKLLTAATTAHNLQTKKSSQGAGVDRHLTGLRLVYDAAQDGVLPGAEESGQGKPSTDKPANFYDGAQLLLADPLLAESQAWKLSTSGLSAGDLLAGTGFGAGFLDGFGINYLTGKQLLKFGIESKHPTPYGNGQAGPHPTNTFAKAIVESLRFMRQLCETEAPSDASSKL